MATSSGMFAAVNGVGSLMEWSVSETRTSNAYVASNTGIGTARVGGISDWSGSVAGKGPIPPFFPNETFSFVGYTSPDNGLSGGDGTRYLGDAICSQITVAWNWVNNELLSWTADFASRSSLTQDTDAPAVDATAPSLDYACGTKITYGADIEIPALTNATLTISANLFQSSNSSTRDAGGCYIKRGPGPIDWTLTAQQEDHVRGVNGYPALGDDLDLKLYTNATEFWHMKWGKQESYTNLTPNRDGQAISRSINIAMNANNGTGIGHIIRPGESTAVWGVTPV